MLILNAKEIMFYKWGIIHGKILKTDKSNPTSFTIAECQIPRDLTLRLNCIFGGHFVAQFHHNNNAKTFLCAFL